MRTALVTGASWGDADRILTQTPPRLRELYGAAVERYRQVVRDTVARGIPPKKVAARVEHALEVRRPRARYLVGLDAQVMARLRTLAPTPVFDLIVARAMGFPAVSKPPDADR